MDGLMRETDDRSELSFSGWFDESEYCGSSCFASLVTDLSLGEREVKGRSLHAAEWCHDAAAAGGRP